jgi:polyisoprenoid-binding protein YceI
MKKLLTILAILVVGFIAVKLSIKSPDQSIPSATESTNGDTIAVEQSDIAQTEQIAANRITAEFDGYGPGGKEEHGSVKASQSTLARTGATFTGSVTFDMNSITSVPVKEQLITHLKGTDFFNVAKYPTATFTITESDDSKVTGNLMMRGMTQKVTLPLTFDPATSTFSSTVRINMELFGIKQTFTDKEFILRVSVK